MKPAIWIISFGTLNFSNPDNRSRIGVVAANVIEAITPNVPLQSKPAAAISPGSDNSNPKYSTYGPAEKNGIKIAKTKNGVSITIRFEIVINGS
jgi:hypothetical protein